MADTFTITIPAGVAEDGTLRVEAFTCRRPTHGELDLGRFRRYVALMHDYQVRVAALEANPAEGAVEKIERLVMLGEEAATKVCEITRRAVRAIAPPTADELLDPAKVGDVAAAARCGDVALQLLEALVVPVAAALPK